jgi:hypothetical protein
LVWDISSGIGPCFPLAEGVGKFYTYAAEQNDEYIAKTSLSAIQAANQSTPIDNYIPLVISGNAKNKQPTLVSHRKLALTVRNTRFALQNLWSP